jgi:putative endonuclease
MREHASGGRRAARYLRGRGPLRLVFTCAVADRGTALRMEHRIKKLPRQFKDMLISGSIALDALERDHDGCR